MTDEKPPMTEEERAERRRRMDELLAELEKEVKPENDDTFKDGDPFEISIGHSPKPN